MTIAKIISAATLCAALLGTATLPASAATRVTGATSWQSLSAGPANKPTSSTPGTVVRDHGAKPIVNDHRGQVRTCINGKCGWHTPR